MDTNVSIKWNTDEWIQMLTIIKQLHKDEIFNIIMFIGPSTFLRTFLEHVLCPLSDLFWKAKEEGPIKLAKVVLASADPTLVML